MNKIILFLLLAANSSCYAMKRYANKHKKTDAEFSKELFGVSHAMCVAYKVVDLTDGYKKIMDKLHANFRKLVQTLPYYKNISLCVISEAMLAAYKTFDDDDTDYDNIMNILRKRFTTVIDKLPESQFNEE